MDGRHDLSVDPTRLLATSGHAFTMDTTATTHPSGQQLRPPYGDLGRPTAQGDTSTLSAYHSRYLASLPLSTGSSFPFLGSMFTGSLPGPPSSPFRASSAGVNNMRQFWPPTPPPDGYGRYGMNTSLFPLFGSVSPSPDNGTFITQGLVSRLGPTGHLSHLLDSHKEHSFFSPGIGLGSPLTPTSHVTPPTPFPPLIPALERHAGFGHMTLGGKELDESQLVGDAEDVRLMKGHADCLIKQDIPSRHSSNERAKSKAEKHSEKLNSDLHKTSSLSVTKEKHEDVKLTKKADFNKQQHHQQQLLNKVPPCKIEINSVPASKRDLLSPPAEPLKPEVSSPSLVTKKTAVSPLPVASPHVSTSDCTIQNAIVDVDKSETRCSKCSASLKGVGIATKVNGGSGDCHTDKNPVTEHLPVNSSRVPADRDSTAIAAAAHASHSTLVSTVSTTVAKSVPTGVTTVNFSHNFEAASTDSKVCHHTSSINCPLLTPTSELAPKPTSCQFPNKSAKTGTDGHITSSHSAPGCKHVTAAVIPTAPKQAVQREVHPEPSHTFVCATDNEKLANPLLTDVCTVKPESAKHLTDIYSVKAESVKPVVAESCSVKAENIDSATVNNAEKSSVESGQVQLSSSQSNSHKLFGKNIATCCKVKDIIKTVGCSQPLSIETSQNISVSQNNENDLSNKITHETATKMPTAPCTTLSSAVYPTIVQKVPCFKSGKIQAINVDNRKKLISPKGDSPPLKMEMIASRSDCEYSQKVPASGWTKATVLPFNWQKSGENVDEIQAINLTVSRKTLKAEPPECSPLSQNVITGNSTLLRTLPCSNSSAKTTSENIPLSSSSMVGVCHPNTLISTNKVKAIPHSNSSLSSPALSGSLLNQPDAVTEAHITHRSPKASFPIISRNSTPPVHLKSTLSHVTANASLHNRSLKSERPTTKRSKLAESEKSSHGGRGTLATLAPKLSKTVGFTKDGQTSHTLSTSSSVSSTSIVFPATVNPCIPVGIAIAQQRQDSSSTTAIGKSQSGSSSTAPSIIASAAHLAPTRVAAEIQPQPELVRDQKGQEITCSTNPVSADSTNLLVAQGPTIVSRQWESEAVTRTALPSSWVAHGSIVAPAVWLGQGTYAATTGPTSTTVPAVPVGSLETSPISLPPGGYQLARDSITGHLFLIPAANIEIVDRTGVWPYSSTPSTLPLQQLVTQHQHTQFEQQVLPQTEAVKIPESTDNSCNIATTCETAVNPNGFKQVDQHVKVEEKPDDTSQVSGVPLASGQTYAFTTFPANCDPSSFSYVLQSSTVMHLAHTQTTAAIQTEPGKRSQGTSPLHCATPSPPPPHNASEQAVQVSVTEDGLEEGEEESDNDSDGVACCESTQVKLSCQSQSVTTAIQVDMDSQTNSEDDDEERKVEMSDSANQTEILLPENLKCESEIEDTVESCEENVKNDENSAVTERKVLDGEDKAQSEPPLEIVESETELAPSLPVESKPVMDFIDHHGLNLLVDSIEEFASREQEALLNSMEKEARSIDEVLNQTHEVKSDSKLISVDLKLETNSNNVADDSLSSNKVKLDADYKPSYKSIDPSCTDGLGLLCALAEQRFFEEALNTEEPSENNKQTVTLEKDVYDCYSFAEETDLKIRLSYMSPSKDSGLLKTCPNSQSKEPLSPSHSFGSPFHVGSSPETMDPTELEMRLRLAELQRKYKEKQRELARLQPKKDKDSSDIEKNQFKKGPGRPRKRRIFTLPRVKHKPVLSVKATTCFPSHSFKSSGSRLLTKKSLITKTLQKKAVKKVNKSLIVNSSFPKLKKKIINSKEKSRSLVKAGEAMKIPDKIIQNKVTVTAMGLSYSSACKQLKSSSPSKESKNECHVQKLIPKAKLEVPNNSSTIHEVAGKNFTQLQPLLSPTSQSCSFERSKIPSIKITTHDNLKMCSSDKPSAEYQSSQSSKPSNSTTTISSSTNLSLHSDQQTESCKLIQPEKLECLNTSEQVRESHVIKGMKRKAEDGILSERVCDKEILQVKKLKTESQSISSKQVEKKISEHKKEEPAFEIITAPETSPKVEKPAPQITDETKGDKTKVPFFDEQAWFVRRSERIFLSDARTPATPQSASNAVTPNSGKKHSIAANGNSTKSDSSAKNTSRSQKLSELSKTPKTAKSQKEVESKKSKNQAVNKFKSKLDEQASGVKKRHLSESSTSSSIGSSSEELCPSSSSDSDSSDSSSSQSENLPLSILVEQAAAKAVSSGWCKRLSTDSDSSDFSSGQSEDIPLSILIGQSTVKVELRSCILTPADLQDKTRVLIMDEGLFYAGHITAIQAPDVYGIVLDGERAHRPHIFSREEILNAAVLEVKPTQTLQLPEGSRICAYWSQQYRCLYPGTVAKGKSSSPSVDPSLLYVEFDDGDSGRIPLDDMRMLPPDFPIVSMEPNPLLILGKRRSRGDREHANEQKNHGCGSKGEKCKSEFKKHKSPLKIFKKKEHKESKKESSKPSIKSTNASSVYTSSSCNTSKLSSVDNHGDVKTINIKRKEVSPEKKSQKKNKFDVKIKSKNSEKKKITSGSVGNVSNSGSSLTSASKPKKHKKHKDDHKHHHHHHHHHHHRHKKHKAEKQTSSVKHGSSQSIDSTVISMKTVTSLTANHHSDLQVPSVVSNQTHSEKHQKQAFSEMKKPELMVKIKTSPIPEHNHKEELFVLEMEKQNASSDSSSDNSHDSDSSDDENSDVEQEQKKVKKKNKVSNSPHKPAKRKDRLPSVEKSKIAAFLPVRQLWRWSGKSFRRPGAKGKAKKEYYRAIQRGKESIKVGDCAVFLSTGRPHLPYIGRIETMWESWGGKMVVKVKWFYHPEETKSGKKLTQLKGALFQSPHFDENDVQTISHKCEVLSWEEYQRKRDQDTSHGSSYGSLFDNNDIYYLAGTYDPILGSLTMEPGVPGKSVLASVDV